MNTVTITIDGVQMPPMKENGLAITPHKLWAANSGRSNCTGEFVGDLVAIKYELKLEWEDLTDEQFSLIDNAVNTMRPFLTVRFCPSAEIGYITRRFYASDPSYGILRVRSGKTRYSSVTAELIEK